MLLIEDIFAYILNDNFLSAFWEYVDPIVLTALITPVFYILLFKPMANQQAEIKEQLVELRRNEQLKALIEAIPDAVFLKDGEGRWLVANELAKQMFQLHNLPWQGKTEMELANMHPAFRAIHEGCLASDEKAWQGGQLLVEEENVTGEDGQCAIIEARKMPMFDNNGQRKGLVVIGRNITERKHAEVLAQQFSRLLQSSFNEIFLFDAHSMRFLQASEGAKKNLGYSDDELKQLTALDIKPLFTRKSFEVLIAPLRLKEQQLLVFETIYRRKDGTTYPTEVRLQFMGGAHPVFLAILQDISERKQAEEKLHITASVFANSQEAILISDADNIIMDVNPAFTRITGYSREEVIGKNPRLLSSGRQNKAFYALMWNVLKQDKAWRGEIWDRRKSGEIYAEQLSISVICDDDGKALRYVAVFSDISHIKAHEAELQRVAHYDALTGIPNRVLLADRMKQAIAQTSREQNMMAVCYLDLDGFKPINDTLGHDVGDKVLIEVASRIGNTIRGGDTVARLGGDEFVVLLLGLEKGEECVATLERLLMAIAQAITVKNNFPTISASIGVSLYPLDNEDQDTLLRHADQAMYVAKQSGKNRFHIYDVALDQRARDQHEFLKSIRHGLEHDQFELHYQPKVNLRTKQLVGVEALIRWQHPERGLLFPAEFLRHIENTELDIEIGEWVTATALAQMSRWQNAGLDIEVSINISGYHLESPRFLERLLLQLAQYPDMPLGKLQIEMLETVALNDIAIVQGIIDACGKIGVGFALDDFGTGYSSLTYLSSLPVDVLKIDQSFVRDMLEDKGDMAIVQGIITLARAFERQTVAEGIETEDQYRVLLDMGCELGQGYGIAHPMTADKLSKWRAKE